MYKRFKNFKTQFKVNIVYSVIMTICAVVLICGGYYVYAAWDTMVNSGEPLTSMLWNDVVQKLVDHEARITDLEARVYLLEHPTAAVCPCGTCGSTRTIDCRPLAGTCCNDTIQICTTAGWVVHGFVWHCKVEHTTPYLFSYIGGKYLIEDDILNTYAQLENMTVKQTEEAYMDNVINDEFKDKDIYQLKLKPTIFDNNYKLQIKEIEPEESHLDKVDLVKVIHSKDSIAFTADNLEGTADTIQCASLSNTKPYSCVDDNGQNCLPQIVDKDDKSIEKQANSSITLKFKVNKDKIKDADNYLLFNAWVNDYVPQIINSPFEDGYSGRSLVLSLQFLKDGQWQTIGRNLHARGLPNSEYRSIPSNLADYLDKNNVLTLKIIWTERHIIDSLNLVSAAKQACVQEVLPLNKAVHSRLGDVRDKILSKDFKYADTVRGDTIDLEFNTGNENVSSDETYDLFLISQGYYHGIRTYLYPYIDTSDSYKQELESYVKELNEYIQKNKK
jgi:hypothetical protein